MFKLYLFDVDGTLVETKSGATFRKSADDWQWLPGRVALCKALCEDGAVFAIASNQAGVAFPWSKFSEEDMQAQIDAVAREIGANYVGVCYTTPNPKALPEYHNPNDERRKPGPGMLLEAMQYYGMPAEQTVMIGDRDDDEQAARAAGVTFIHADEFFKPE
jgi:D-glycero-D-manno-heptose 1,7-bisphosphate phosphatase